MNKFSQQYAFSSMLKCGFCDCSITRKSWNSGSVHKKIIWHCVTSTKKGKKFCPPSKGVSEDIIENAFVSAFNLLIKEDGEIIDTFLSNVEQNFQSKENKKQLTALKKEINSLELKISKLLDLHLSDKIDTIDYELKYSALRKELDGKLEQRLSLEVIDTTQKDMDKHISNLRKYFNSNAIIENFDATVFKNVVEKVIVGGIDKDGTEEPYRITFVFKTGYIGEINAPNPKGRKAKKTDKNECCHQGQDPRGVRCGTMSNRKMIIFS